MKFSYKLPLKIHSYCRAGGGILLSEGETWHRNRKLLTKLFFFGQLKSYLPRMDSITHILIDKLHATNGQPVG